MCWRDPGLLLLTCLSGTDIIHQIGMDLDKKNIMGTFNGEQKLSLL